MGLIKKHIGSKSRLTAGEVFSSSDSLIAGADAGFKEQVLAKLQGDLHVEESMCEEVYDEMVKFLQNRPLMIHFKPKDLFKGDLGNSYKNAFTPPINQTEGYLETRNTIENRLFHYEDPQSITNVRDVIDRIRKRAGYRGGSNPNFMGCIRPKYGVLNIFGRDLDSLETKYGQSHIQCKEYIKHRSTFTNGDSFGVQGPDYSSHLSDYHHMGAILQDMQPSKLEALYKLSVGEATETSREARSRYIEAQVHTEICFSRDVEKICLYRPELEHEDQAVAINMLLQIESVAAAYNIELEFFE